MVSVGIRNWNHQTLRQQILACFLLLTMLPLVQNVILSYFNDRNQILDNRDQIATMDVQQITRDLAMELSGYEAILYQLYTDDTMADLVVQLDQHKNTAVVRNQLRRQLRSVFWLQDYITSIMVITKGGETVFYDRLSFSAQTNVSLEALDCQPKELFDRIAAENGTTYLPTQYATYFNGHAYDLFYLGHRVVGEQINQTDAVILMGVDAALLRESLSQNWLGGDHQKYMFLYDDDGRLIWYPDRNEIGETIPGGKAGLLDFVADTNRLDSRELVVYYRDCEPSGWTVVSVLDGASFTQAIDHRLVVTVLSTLLSFGAVTILMLVITGHLTRAVNDVCRTMQIVSQGDLSIRANCSRKMTSELRVIAEGLNVMADRLQELMQAQKESAEKIKNAEIAALEAQLNPHFLYNTLDTINWMAIEEEQYAISNVISALAKTMRYGIDRSNSIVTMEEEVNWLKQYLFLHQNRLKSSFHCELDIPPEVLSCRVHKLLLQPFVENAMIHGFTGEQTDCRLRVSMGLEAQRLHVEIEDNGCGIPQAVLDSLSTNRSRIDCGKRYHGMQNAINRLLLYYGDEAQVQVTSSPQQGTCIAFSIPTHVPGEEELPCESSL